MNSIVIRFSFLSFIFALAACVVPDAFLLQEEQNVSYQPSVVQSSETEENYVFEDEDKDDDERSSRRSYDEQCEDDDDCEDICKDVYQNRDAREDCEELTVSEVEGIEEAYKALKSPDIDDLEDLRTEDLEQYIEVDEGKALHTLAKEWNQREAKDILEWIAIDYNVTDIFKEADKNETGVYCGKSENDDLIKAIILKAHNNTLCTGSKKNKRLKLNAKSSERGAFIASIESFFEKALEENNDEALAWFHDVVFDEGINQDWFLFYCDLAKGLDNRLGEEFLEYEYFEDYLQDTLKDNKEWFENPPGRVKDLQSDWWRQCKT